MTPAADNPTASHPLASLASRTWRSHMAIAAVGATMVAVALTATVVLHEELRHDHPHDDAPTAFDGLSDSMLTLTCCLGGALVVVLIVCARVLANAHARRIVQPLRDLIAASEELSAGRIAEVPDTDIEEVRRLADGFVAMQASIRRAHEGLEQRVQDRTAELEVLTAELRLAKRDLQNQNARLEQTLVAAESATKAKSEFLANMSHEIRTPLTAILGFADFLAEHARDAEQTDAIATITQNGRHLLDLLNDILDLSKVEAGGLEIQLERVPLFALVESVRKLMDVRAKEKCLSLEVVFPGFVPESIETDPTRLRQILLNLVGNALKFTEKGGVLVVCTLEQIDSATPQLAVSVMDSGIGMSDAQQRRLFQPFSQADASTTRQFGGTGLGLFISRNLARKLGGEIECHSTPGQGSIFRLSVKTGSLEGVRLVSVEPGQAEPQAPIPARRADHVETATLPDCRILLAEDTPVNQRLLSYLLTKAGATVQVANNGREAIDHFVDAIAVGAPPDLIVLDMQMPILDGYEAARMLKSMPGCPPVLALTAHAMREDRERCLAAGCDGYATKPIQRTALLQTIGDLLAARRSAGRA
ncbi:MAG: response regulator [Planctomycetes bacterium]|nr:response regulator [Planctomycetota bacterium]